MAEHPRPKEQVAKLYLEKVESLARGMAERDGPLFDERGEPAEDTNLGGVADLWDRRDPEVDEATAWQEALGMVEQAVAQDPKADRAALEAEVPVAVGLRVFPLRARLLQSSGALGYRDLVTFADKVERLAAKRRAGQEPTEDDGDGE